MDALGLSATRSPALNLGSSVCLFFIKQLKVVSQHLSQLTWSQTGNEVVLRVSLGIPLVSNGEGLIVVNDGQTLVRSGLMFSQFSGGNRFRL